MKKLIALIMALFFGFSIPIDNADPVIVDLQLQINELESQNEILRSEIDMANYLLTEAEKTRVDALAALELVIWSGTQVVADDADETISGLPFEYMCSAKLKIRVDAVWQTIVTNQNGEGNISMDIYFESSSNALTFYNHSGSSITISSIRLIFA